MLKTQFDNKEDAWYWLQMMTDSICNCLIAVDNKGKIIFYNRSSEKFLDLEKEKVLGHHIKEVFPDNKMINLLQTPGEKLKRQVQTKDKFGDKIVEVNQIPILVNNKLLGAVELFDRQIEIEKLNSELDNLEVDVLDLIGEETLKAMTIVDENGFIIRFNHAYEEFLGIQEEDILGLHVTEVIENTRLHIVTRTGRKEVGEIQCIQGKDVIVNRFPIKKNGEVIGAFGEMLFRDIEELKSLVKKVKPTAEKVKANQESGPKTIQAKYSFDDIITQNKRMEYLKRLGKQTAKSNSTVLIQGDSGTGKELFAHAIHGASYRKYGSFICVNCAAIPMNLLESELFGYEEGAFTGARKGGKPGKFELANGGTIFLDEINSLPLQMQAKLLRVLQENEIQRIGGTDTTSLDVRVIVTTNEDLEEKVDQGEFRRDLYYRLNVIRIKIPPLCERLDDIPLLANSILENLVDKLGVPPKKLAPQTISCLMGYDWPGNVRELQNFIERSMNLASEEVIYPKYLPDIIHDNERAEKKSERWNMKGVVRKVESSLIKQALKQTDGNKTEAAKLLDIHRTSLYKKMKQYKIDTSLVN